MPVDMRLVPALSTLDSGTADTRKEEDEVRASRGASSTMVFQLSQAGHFPSHFALS
jgi:hypothetical protein